MIGGELARILRARVCSDYRSRFSRAACVVLGVGRRVLGLEDWNTTIAIAVVAVVVFAVDVVVIVVSRFFSSSSAALCVAAPPLL